MADDRKKVGDGAEDCVVMVMAMNKKFEKSWEAYYDTRFSDSMLEVRDHNSKLKGGLKAIYKIHSFKLNFLHDMSISLTQRHEVNLSTIYN